MKNSSPSLNYLKESLLCDIKGDANSSSNIPQLSKLASVLAHELSHVDRFSQNIFGKGLPARFVMRGIDVLVPGITRISGDYYNQAEYLPTLIQITVSDEVSSGLIEDAIDSKK